MHDSVSLPSPMYDFTSETVRFGNLTKSEQTKLNIASETPPQYTTVPSNF